VPSPEPGSGNRPRAGIVLAGAALLLWPSLLNWHPYLFWDTYGYFLQGKAYAQLVGALTGVGPVPAEAMTGWLGAAGRMLEDDASIRSPTWSLATYLLAALGGFWLLAAANALVAAATIELVLTRLFDLPWRRRLLVFAGLALLTSLSWFASYLMPDLYAGLLILAAAALTMAWASLRPVERAALLLLYLAAITFHPSHLLLALGLSGVALILPGGWLDRGARAARLALPALAAAGLLLAIGWTGFGEASLTPRGPPFLLARSWEDGPARAYLAAACPEAGWAICPLLDRLAPSAQEFLWRPADSYWSMSPELRAALRAEEKPILLRAILADPLGQLEAMLANAARQLGRFGLEDFVLGRGAEVTAEDYEFLYLPGAPAAVWGLGGFSAMLHVTTIAALPVLLVAWWRTGPSGAPGRLALFVGCGLLLNAAICGILSGPHPRYQSRVVWLLPLLAAGVLAGAGTEVSRRRDAPAPPAP
jgi:hypothetical protein